MVISVNWKQAHIFGFVYDLNTFSMLESSIQQWSLALTVECGVLPPELHMLVLLRVDAIRWLISWLVESGENVLGI